VSSGADLNGLRVLVVEDQSIVALHVADVLRDAGCMVIGPVANLKPALDLACAERLDFAVLDVNLDGDHIFPVAQELENRGIPFVLATGYSDSTLPEHWRGRPCLRKPFTDAQLAELVGRLAPR
jgi:CheY-like chemotaxis protein